MCKKYALYDAGCRGGVKKEQKESEKYIKVQKSATIVPDFTFTKHSACLMLYVRSLHCVFYSGLGGGIRWMSIYWNSGISRSVFQA